MLARRDARCGRISRTRSRANTGADPRGGPGWRRRAEKQPVARSAEFVGRIEAPSRVDVRARVTGFLDAVLFKEGDRVREGDRSLPDRARHLPGRRAAGARRACCRRRRSTRTPRSRHGRTEELVKTSAASGAERDQRVAEQKSAQGDVVTADANLKTAQDQSRLHGDHGPDQRHCRARPRVTKGNVVGPDTGALTTIVSQDPMYVTFPVSQREFLNVKAERVAERATEGPGDASASPTAAPMTKPGGIDFVDVTVDRATDTVLVRATIAQPDAAA